MQEFKISDKYWTSQPDRRRFWTRFFRNFKLHECFILLCGDVTFLSQVTPKSKQGRASDTIIKIITIITLLNLKFDTDPGLLEIRRTLTALSLWFCLHKCFYYESCMAWQTTWTRHLYAPPTPSQRPFLLSINQSKWRITSRLIPALNFNKQQLPFKQGNSHVFWCLNTVNLSMLLPKKRWNCLTNRKGDILLEIGGQ